MSADTPTSGGSGDDHRTLDVRDGDRSPFDRITEELSDLDPGDRLVVINSFEPEPLYGVLEARGFTYESTRVGPEEWHVTIEHA